MNLELIDRIIEIEKIDSTQTLAKEILKEKSKGNILIIAKEQISGYGRLGSKWSSEYGGLYFTLITKMQISDENISKLSLKTANAIKKTLAQHNINSRIKPPNDVYAKTGKSYKKISGIIIEALPHNLQEKFFLFGIGINTNNELPKNLKQAISMKKILKKEVNNTEILKIFLKYFWSEIKELQCSIG